MISERRRSWRRWPTAPWPTRSTSKTRTTRPSCIPMPPRSRPHWRWRNRSVGVRGPDLITAVATGADLACRLALGFVEPPQGHGYYLIPMLGLYAAAAACGKLLRLNEDELIEAFALASCQAICSDELVTYAPSHLRAIRDAFTAKAGILGALLARQGVKAFDRAVRSARRALWPARRRPFRRSAYAGRSRPRV